MTDSPLKGVGVLVTRPRAQAAELVELIQNKGGNALCFPVIDIVPRDESAIEADSSLLPAPDIALFVSRNAVAHGLAYAAGATRGAVGPTTAAAIEAGGQTVEIQAANGFDSESLLAEPTLQNVSGTNIRIIRGDGGRELLADTLRERGATVDYLSVYERVLPDCSPELLAEVETTWRGGGLHAITVMSVRTLRNLIALLPIWCKQRINDLPLVTPVEVELEMEVDEQAQKPKNRKGLVWLVLLVSVIALAAGAYTLRGNWLADDESTAVSVKIEALDRRIDESNAALAALEARLGQIPHPDFSPEIDGLRRDVEDQLRLLGSLPSRMTTIEDSVSSLAGISAGARQTFLLAEAEYYLQIANAQLQLANNPHLASLALGMANERVAQLSDPGLTDVRRAISDELATLEVMKKPDIEGATLTLASLARVVESLPLAGSAAEDGAVVEDNTEQSGVEQAWASVKDAVSTLVKVTPPDQAKLALVSPDAGHFLRNNLALQLQSARLALLRGEQTIFEHALDDTSALLSNYFDTSSAQVMSAQVTIAEVRSGVFAADAPDISRSLRLLRQYRTLSETVE